MKRRNDLLMRTLGPMALCASLLACAESPETIPGGAASGGVVRISATSFAPGGDAPAVAGEATVGRVDAYLFETGRLTRIFSELPLAGTGCSLQLESLSGRLYVVADGRPELLDAAPEEGLSEQEWLAATIGGDSPAAERFSTARLDLSEVTPGTASVPLALTHGTARVDLRLRVAGEAEVRSITFADAACAGPLWSRDGAAVKAGTALRDLEIRLETPLAEDTPAVAYLYEQDNASLRVRLEAEIDGKPSTLEGALPQPLLRNRIYTVTVRKDVTDTDARLTVETWGDGGETPLDPDLDTPLTVDTERSELPDGVRVEDGGSTLVLPYTETEVLLAVACDSQLEVIPMPDFPLVVEEVSTGATPDDVNLFRIRKGLFAPNREAAEVPLRFRRKGLEQFYPEERILLTLEANPSRTQGALEFDNAEHTVDFERYVDNELGRFVLAQGKRLEVEFDPGEDPWIRLSEADGDARTVRVVAGWRPNDPTADGRRQAARLVVSNLGDGSQREVYTVVRRNWGLPVTWFHGVWWCKYNARGRSRHFEDQILSSADPAVEAGKSLYEYLGSCSPEEYFDLWGWGYQGDSGQGLKVVEQDGKAVLDGFSTGVTVHINKLPADALSPDGYELPSMEEFNRVFDATDYIWMMWSGSHTLRTPWEGHSAIKRTQQRRSDVTVGSLTLNELISVRMWSPDFPDDEGITWYGAAAQWNADGIRHSNHYNNILFGVHSPEGSGWYITGGMANLYMTRNGAGTKDTRTLRFKKSAVEYVYGPDADRPMR